MKKNSTHAFTVGLFVLSSQAGKGQTLTATADSFLSYNGGIPAFNVERDGEDNFGGRGEVIMGNNNSPNSPRHGIFRFDVSSLSAPITAGATLNSATFTLYERNQRDGLNGDGSEDFTIFPLVAENSGWIQGTSAGSAPGYSATAGAVCAIYKAAPASQGGTDGVSWFGQGGGASPSGALPAPPVFQFGTDTGPALGTGAFNSQVGVADSLVINLDTTALQAVLSQWLADGELNAGLAIESAGNRQLFFDSLEGDGMAAELTLVFDSVPGDSDFDGIPDANETNTLNYQNPTDTGTDPLNPDTDGDGISDGDEIDPGIGTPVFTDPTTNDTDDDGLTDDVEVAAGLDPNVDGGAGESSPGANDGPQGPAGDPDNDGLTNQEELEVHGTNPLDSDSDDDDLNDGDEIAAGTNPLNSDTDDDGLSDGDEVDSSIGSSFLSNPLSADTDGDGIPDGREIEDGTDPNNPSDNFLPRVVGELISYYNFDEGVGSLANDTAPFGNPETAMTNQGTVSWETANPLIGSASLDLPGNASMQVADALGTAGPDGGPATAFTLMAWVNMDDNPGYDGIFQTRTENWGLNVNGTSFDFRFDNSGGGSVGLDSAAGTASVGEWRHIAMSWESDGIGGWTGRFYVDGVLAGPIASQATNPSVTSIYSATGQLWNIGDDPVANGRELNAQLDDLAIFSSALSDEDIEAISDFGRIGVPLSAMVSSPFTSVTIISTSSGSPGSDDFTIVWESPGLGSTFRIVSSDDLSIPVSQWIALDGATGIPDGGETTSFTIDGAFSAGPRRFYAVVRE